jgi:hypothetical protein
MEKMLKNNTMKTKYFIFFIAVSMMGICSFCKKEQTKGNTENTTGNKKLQTVVEVNVIDYTCENIYTNETYRVLFQLKNVGKHPFYLDQVSPSCGCISTEWNRQAVNPGEISEIEVEMNWEEEKYFSENIKVYCNVDKSPITLTISGNVKGNILKKEVAGKGIK